MDLVVPTNPVLTHADRCDTHECDARAYVKVFIRYGDELGHLLFCAYHFRVKQAGLEPVALTVIDERHLLQVKLESGAHE